MILDTQQAKAVIDKALSFATADETRVNLSGGRRGNTRFALNAVTTCGDTDSLSISVRAAFGRRHASAAGNELGDEAIRRLVAKAEDLARLAPEDPEYVGELGPREYAAIDPWSDSTAAATAERRADAVAEAINVADAGQLESSGYYEHGRGFSAVGNSKGLFAWGRTTDADFSVTMRADGGTASGWAAGNSRDIDEIDCAAAIRLAAEKAVAGRNRKPLAPGVYPVILEPAAVEEFLGFGFYTLGARQADEGRSFFAAPGGGNKIGQKVVSDTVTIRSDPGNSAVAALPFAGDGLPTQAHAWIDQGVVRQLVYDRYWAAKQGVTPTGSPANMILDGGAGTLEEMIRNTDRAVLVTRFWYIRFVDPQTILLTGLTRDGTFWVEDGEIRHAVNGFRFNDSPISLLSKVTAMTAPVRVGNAFVPAIASSEFTLSSVSDSV